MPNRRLTLFALMVLHGCATRQPLPAGNELEEASEPAPERSVAAAPAASAPGALQHPPEHDELAAAFTPEKAEAPKSLEHNVGAAPAPPDDSIDALAAARQRFSLALASARQRLAGGNKEDASEALKELAPLAEAAGPEAQQRFFEAEVRARRANKDSAGVARAAEHWLKVCGPKRVDSCRGRALAALAARGFKDRVAAIRKHDACVARAEADPAHPPDCLGGALAFYEREGDLLMTQRALLARAVGAGRAAPPQAFWDAERACKQPRCSEGRRRALRAGSASALRADDVHQSALMALQEMKLASEELPAEQRAYARTALVDKLCVAMEQREGVGACRKLEKEALGRYYFKDFSRGAVRVEGLSPDRVKSVNDQFGVMIQECLAGEADRLEPPASEHYEIRWLVLNDGRVDQVHLDKKDRDEGPLAQCLRTQFAIWRYPKYRGEWQHVEQRFVVSARERRSSPEAVR